MLAFVKWIAITLITALLICDVNPVPSASTSPLWRGTYTQSSYWYSDYAVPKPTPKKDYLPKPQFCPETGRTVCAEVKPSYPTDDVFEVIRSAKAKRFNISSEFVDESQNDEEPNFYEEKPQQPQYEHQPKHEGYVVYQTAVHYDSYANNIPNQRQLYTNPNPNYPNYQPLYPIQDFGYNKNRPEIVSHQKHTNIEHLSHPLPYAPHLPQIVYPKENPNHYYPQPEQQLQPGYHQSFPNDMTSQSKTRFKRQAGTDVVDPACPSRMILVEPKAGLNDKSQWKYVINLSDRDPRLKQAIKVEVCQTPGQPCSNQVSLPFGFISRCRQKYIKKKLLSLDSSGQSISSENFFSPSCCVCEIVRNNNKKKK